MKPSMLWMVAVLLALGGGWGGLAIYRAQRNLVTLNVRNADLRAVARSIEWQTWEKIIVHHDVTGKITMNVVDAPLTRVMGILAEQSSARWTAVYPLYSSRRSLATLKLIAAGNSPAETNGWSAFRSRPMRGGGMFGANVQAENERVTVNVLNQDLEIATLALARFAQAQVVPEEGTTARVDLVLTGATMSQAVAQLAGKADRSWSRFYTLQPGFRFDTARRGPPRDAAADDEMIADTGTNQVSITDAVTNLVSVERRWRELSAEEQERREQQFQALLTTMTPAERQQAEQQRQRWQEMRNMTPEQRRQRMAQRAADPVFQQRMQQRALQRLLNSTPDQRIARDQRTVARLTGQTPPSRP